MKQLRRQRWLTTEEAHGFLSGFIPSAQKHWFHSGRFRSKRLPEPREIAGRLYWSETELQQWLVRQGLAEWSEI